jgi:hypothetical protein
VAKHNQVRRKLPWKSQVRITSRTIIGSLVLLIVAGMYLAVNGRVAQAGREVLVLQNERAESVREIADLTSTLAELTTPEHMFERAQELGYRPAGMGDMLYINVDAYVAPEMFQAPRPPSSTTDHASSLSPAYTETLGEWLIRIVRPRGGGVQ